MGIFTARRSASAWCSSASSSASPSWAARLRLLWPACTPPQPPCDVRAATNATASHLKSLLRSAAGLLHVPGVCQQGTHQPACRMRRRDALFQVRPQQERDLEQALGGVEDRKGGACRCTGGSTEWGHLPGGGQRNARPLPAPPPPPTSPHTNASMWPTSDPPVSLPSVPPARLCRLPPCPELPCARCDPPCAAWRRRAARSHQPGRRSRRPGV
jgi:hypothetical protein